MLRHRLADLQIKFLPEEHRVLRVLKNHSIHGRPIVVAVSGGLDSVVLLYILNRLKPVLKYRLFVAYIHHGAGVNLQVKYRNKAQKFVKNLAHNLNLPFYTNKKMCLMKSEGDFRNFRYSELAKIILRVSKKEGEAAVLALAHHRDDLVETQLLRLIRGTSVGGLQAMKMYSEELQRLRPMLILNRKEILNIAKKLKLNWLDDPSNASLDPLRNWLRRSWLPALEKKVPGGGSSLARSMNHLAEISVSIHEDTKKNMDFKNGIDRMQFASLGHKDRLQMIVSYMRAIRVQDYTQGQVEEVCRRLGNGLDNRRRGYRFNLVCHQWTINAQRIKAERI